MSTGDASNVELVNVDQSQEKNPNAGKSGYDSDGNPNIDICADKPE